MFNDIFQILFEVIDTCTSLRLPNASEAIHNDVIKWKYFPRYWPFALGIHRSPVNSPHKGKRRGALTFSVICARISSWANNREAGDSGHNSAHYDVIVMLERCNEPVPNHNKRDQRANGAISMFRRTHCSLLVYVTTVPFIFSRPH